jgi:hypothetical protein
MRRLRHLALLVRDIAVFSGGVGAVWMIPLIAIVLAVAITVATVNTGLPYVVYTLL